MSINLESLSAKELAALITQANQRKKKLAKRKPLAAVRKKLAALAKAEGYALTEIFGGRPGKESAAKPGRAPKVKKAGGKRGKVAAKYRNPAKPEETWSGRGKQPRWLAAEVAKGKQLGDFAI